MERSCCVTRYAPGACEMSKVDRILLKFRPIAPKPGTTASDSSSPERSAADTFSKSGGSRRKHAKDKKRTRCNGGIRRRRTVPPPAVTLPLLPETPDRKDPPLEKSKKEPEWLNFENQVEAATLKADQAAVFGGSVVTVECMTEESELEWLGRREEEVKAKLGEDTCPGFISDDYGRVTWRNRAYSEMVGGGGKGLWLAMKVSGVPYPYYYCSGGFTCRVRVQYACGKERTVPCDAWRMASGGFAWRLDVKAALSLTLAL